jgi:hypothetical protein
MTKLRVLGGILLIAAISFSLAMCNGAGAQTALPIAACRTEAQLDVLILARLGGANLGEAIIAANRGSTTLVCLPILHWQIDQRNEPLKRILIDDRIFEVRRVDVVTIGPRGPMLESRVALVLARVYPI